MAVVIRGDKETEIILQPGKVLHAEGRVVAGCPRKACGLTSSWSLSALQRVATSYHARQTDQRSPTAKVECGWCGHHSIVSFAARKTTEPPLTP